MKTTEEKVTLVIRINTELWLCGPQASHINGQELIVDGGITVK